MAPTTNDINDRIAELQGKALDFITDAQAPVADYVGRIAGTVASRLPEDRPELLAQGIDTVVGQVDFAKKVLDAQVDLVKAVLDAAVKPVRPARRPAAAAKARTVRAA